MGNEPKYEPRVKVSRLLAKAQAYKECGKDRLAWEYAVRLIAELEEQGILPAGSANAQEQV